MAENGVPEKEKCTGVIGVVGGSAKGLLLVLLTLAVCFGYFYFFTDILRSKEEIPMQPEVYSTEVKMPLPERPAEPAAIPAEETSPVAPPAPSPPGNSLAVSPEQASKEPKVAVKTELKKETAPPASTAKIPQKPLTTVDKKAPVPLPARTTQAPSKAAAATPKKVMAAAKPVLTPEKPKEVKPVAKPALKPKTVAAKPAPTPAKPKTAAAKPAQSAAQQKTVAAKPASEKQGGKYTLVVGSYVLQSSMLADKAKLERAGLNPSVAAGKKRSEPMNRLLVSEFGSYSSARAELSRVKKASKDAFLLQEKGKFTVYAGSYFRHERALQEQDRLRGQGFVPIVKKSAAPVSTYTLTSGSFPTREAAEKEAARLRKLGFNPLPSPLKKQ